jgi:Glycosyl hydrolases family 15
MGWARVALGLVAVVAAGILLVSGGSEADPQTPEGLPGMPPPFLGTAVVGGGGLTAAIDSYGDVVDLRAPGPAGRALIDNPSDRQTAGTVPAHTGIVPRVRIDGGPALALWRADAVSQRYLPRANVAVTVARFPGTGVEVKVGATEGQLALSVRAWPRSGPARAAVSLDLEGEARCRRSEGQLSLSLVCGVDRRQLGRGAGETIAAVARRDRRWLRRARPLGPGAPRWAARMYQRSLLVLRALTDMRTGAVAAGARDGWAYVWPRDAATAALAFAAAGYRSEARRITRFLLGLGLEGAARFHGDGSPAPGRDAQGDATGWVAAAAHAAGTIGSAEHAARILSPIYPVPWRQRADYQESGARDFLANAIASGEHPGRIASEFGRDGGLAREAGGRGGLDSAAAWAVRPFPHPPLFDAVRRTLLRLVDSAGPYGLRPGEDWAGGEDPWPAPTAWAAWSLAALGERRQALRLLSDLRRAATPAGALPERVDARTGIARSTTPLAWSHAFAILALRELWPSR